MSKSSEQMRRQWQNPELRKRMLVGCVKGGESSRDLPRRAQIERVLRRQRTIKLKRLSLEPYSGSNRIEDLRAAGDQRPLTS